MKTGSGIYIADINVHVCQAGLHNCFPPKKCVYKMLAAYNILAIFSKLGDLFSGGRNIN